MSKKVTPESESLTSNEDPALDQILDYLAHDIARYPERLKPIDEHLMQRIKVLVGGLEVDLDAPLSVDDE